jgi:cytidylate kinase
MKTDPFIIIAIDGPAASGKSSTARALAARFKLLHVDTGMHYRAITWCLLQKNIELNNPEAVKKALSSIRLKTHIHENSTFICVDEQELKADLLRSQHINNHVSQISMLSCVRNYLAVYQHSLANFAKKKSYPGLIMEGRDIGSVIFPTADFKFFLYADVEARAARRVLEDGGQDTIQKRDQIDSTRAIAPLKCPEDAVVVDTTHMPLEKVVEQLSALIC